MGFHVNPQNLQLYDTGVKKQNGEMKFYINAGTDTYKFASLFQERCEELGINYYFKVIDARRTEEYNRNDKMCIYTEQKEAEKILEIIQKVIQEHPEKLQQLKNTIKINIEQTPLSKMFNDSSRNKKESETQDFNNLSIEQLEKVLKQTEEQNQIKREELDSLLRKQKLIEQIISAQQEGKE